MSKLTLTTPSDREIVITRWFNAPRRLVFEAWTRPEHVRRFLFGPPGWIMTVCEIDARAGGRYRYAWEKDDGEKMSMSGTFQEVKAHERIVATERFDQSWYPGGALVTNTFTEEGGKTLSTIAILYDSKEARDIAANSPMDQGMEMGFQRLDALLETWV